MNEYEWEKNIVVINLFHDQSMNELYNHNVVKKKVKRKETFISLSLAQ